MPLLQLSDDAILDTTNGVGIIMDTRHGIYYELNPVATLMVQAALNSDTVEDALHGLAQRIDATEEVLRTGLDKLVDQLDDQRLLTRTGAHR
jgi:hypothetical protein